ncbi:hypothetical protein C8J57DRAFT_1337645 [Mycena rebaudengoi]|nr:hypothetical protein C8J57DRAFT_1337645 [Mycena rebaudengoi]
MDARSSSNVPAPSHHAHLPTEPQITHPPAQRRTRKGRAAQPRGPDSPPPSTYGPSSYADYTTRTRATRPRTEEQQPAPAACQNESRTHHAPQNQGRPRPAQETSPPHILKVPRTHIDSMYHSPLPTYARCTPGSKRASKQAGCRAHLDGEPPAADSSSHPPAHTQGRA